MRHIVIGDIHGCIDELKLLIHKLELQQDDRLYFIGDLIDRGPDSGGVVKYVRELSEKNVVVLILGNHEEKFLRYLDHKKNNQSALKNMKGTEKFDELIQQLDETDIKFLSSAYTNYNISSENICLVHGGISGNNKIDLCFNHQYSHDLLKSNKGFELLLKTRFLDESGNFISLGQENETSVFWADQYDGKYGKVIFGHHAIIGDKPVEYKHAINIDNGCVYGGSLSACVINSHSTINYKSIKSNQEYYERK
jgi:calcineurin-like phosphoesterase family protein